MIIREKCFKNKLRPFGDTFGIRYYEIPDGIFQRSPMDAIGIFHDNMKFSFQYEMKS